MIFLFLSIACSTFLVLAFKFFKQFGIDNIQGIVFNYITCVITGIVVSGKIPSAETVHENWFPYAVFLGISFFMVFDVMGYVAANIGVTLTSVAGKLSMVIPVTAAILLYDQQLTVIKIAGLVLALTAVYLTSVTRDKKDKKLHTRGLFFALIIFISSGINDSVMNYAFAKFLSADEFGFFTISIFSFASAVGVLVMIYRSIFKGKIIQLKSIIGGIILGIPNYFSVIFLLKTLNIPDWESSVVFPVNNIGVVILTAISGWFLFKEQLSKTNLTGIAIAVLAIGLMIFAKG